MAKKAANRTKRVPTINTGMTRVSLNRLQAHRYVDKIPHYDGPIEIGKPMPNLIEYRPTEPHFYYTILVKGKPLEFCLKGDVAIAANKVIEKYKKSLP